LKTYSRGQGMLGDTTWKPVPEVVAALEDAFYLSFGTIVPTGKRHLFGIDVSGSMGTNYITAGKDKKTGKPIPTPVQCRSAAACLAMLGMRIEPRSYAFGFTSSFQELNITANDRLLDVERKVYYSNFGTTDCAVPMTHALRNKLEVDAFVVLTDNETYAGSKHPTVALEEYRQRMGIDAKLIVVGMVSNGFTIADPNDPRQMDVVGFDSSAPSIMADFVREEGSKRNRAA
jgi:60 kDa SS-A/Ro ribonucleoprotein